tara:strand:- start:14915 stop:15925 length:1011 start_codon:yes stop_codon:yes gene_type:complete
MVLIKKRRCWEIPENEATPEHIFMNRRSLIKKIGIAGLSALGGVTGFGNAFGADLKNNIKSKPGKFIPKGSDQKIGLQKPLYPAKRNPAFTLDRPLTDEKIASKYNNFYEFTNLKKIVWKMMDDFKVRPWQIEITGHIEKPWKGDVYELIRRFPLEERLYRFRCVEAWAMAVPWTGFPMKELIKFFQPTSSAEYVRIISFYNREIAPGQKYRTYEPWPYVEGLSMEEAMNELTLLVTGIYGHELPKQHGAPLRLITPWKYGYKSIKSIVRIEFREDEPDTFWNRIAPREYDFSGNVNPGVPHPRWSQQLERMIPSEEKQRTLLYNGYEENVEDLYF